MPRLIRVHLQLVGTELKLARQKNTDALEGDPTEATSANYHALRMLLHMSSGCTYMDDMMIRRLTGGKEYVRSLLVSRMVLIAALWAEGVRPTIKEHLHR